MEEWVMSEGRAWRGWFGEQKELLMLAKDLILPARIFF